MASDREARREFVQELRRELLPAQGPGHSAPEPAPVGQRQSVLGRPQSGGARGRRAARELGGRLKVSRRDRRHGGVPHR